MIAADHQPQTLRQTYNHYYQAVRHRNGKRAPGRNVVAFGVRTRHGVRVATAREVARSIRTFKRWLAPPPAPIAQGDAVSTVPAKAGGRYAIPNYIVQCESHGSYRAVNPSSGAGGAYQVLPSTWRAYGGRGLPQDAAPAEQDRVARLIWLRQGAGAWSCAG